MKKLVILLVALVASLSAWAQTAQLVRNMVIIQEFSGSSALKDATSAAAAKGDIIVLSSGNFNNPGVITKSVSIYGQGMENSSAVNGERTYVKGKLEYRLTSEGALDGIHIEGLYIEDDLNILTSIGTSAVVDDFKVIKCHSGGVFFYQKSTNVLLQNCKFDRDVRSYPSAYTTTLQMDNCYVEGNIFNFADGSDVTINHCLLHNNWYQNYSGAFKYNDCVIYKDILLGATANKCIFTESSVSGSITDCWMGLSNSEIYVTDGEDGTYSESKDFTVKDEFVGTDNTLVGLQGGIGWNKTPSMSRGIQQDEDGYYLIGSAEDWDVFAELVKEDPAANARMTRDIDLGDSQTHISPTWYGDFSSNHYHGIFDGQGNTLTVHYDSSTNTFNAPFGNTSGATIMNLHVDGTINVAFSNAQHTSGVISNSAGNDVIKNVWVSAEIVSTGITWLECAAFIGCNNCGSSEITDCLFTGSITTDRSYNGCFVGWLQNNSPCTITNCLSTGTFTYGGSSEIRGKHTNCYVKQFPSSIPEAMRCTDEQLADGTIATALQAGRDKVVWVQNEEIGEPMLRLFLKKRGDVNVDGKVDVEDVNAIINIILELKTAADYLGDADIVKDGKVDVEDVNEVINIILAL